MLKIIQYDTVKKYKLYIPFDVNTNSVIFYDKDVLHKIPTLPNFNLPTIIEYISECEMNGVIEIKNFICNGTDFAGYSVKNYKNYKSLRKNKNRSLLLKIEDCNKIIEAFNELTECNLMYNDYHRGNILLNKNTGDIKICDLDNVINSDAESFEKSQLESVAFLCIMYLYNIDYEDIEELLKNDVKIDSNNLFKKYLSSLDGKKLSNFSKTLNKLDLSFIEENMSKIKDKVKTFRRNYIPKDVYYNRYF